MHLLKCFQNDGVLTREQIDEILVNSTVSKKADELLRHLIYSYSGEYSEVMKVFDECDQKHIANFIQAGGGE